MGEVFGQSQFWDGFQIFAGFDSRVRWSAAMCFDQDGDAATLAQLCKTLKDLDILIKAKNIAAGMAVDKLNLTLCGKLEL